MCESSDKDVKKGAVMDGYKNLKELAGSCMFIVLLGVFLAGCIQEEAKPKEKGLREVLKMKIQSSAFEHNQPIPKKYTCDGEDVSPNSHLLMCQKELKAWL